jgi:predicted fused transcriptional regulator/phosphomethylpyrimidine kinase
VLEDPEDVAAVSGRIREANIATEEREGPPTPVRTRIG